MRFIDTHKGRFGVAPSTYYDAKDEPPSKRGRRDAELRVHIARVHATNYGVYGPRKVWLQLNQENIEVACCTVERLMKDLSLQGIRRGKRWKTTTADPTAARPADLVQRRFNPARPDALWVADFTYVATWVGKSPSSVRQRCWRRSRAIRASSIRRGTCFRQVPTR